MEITTMLKFNLTGNALEEAIKKEIPNITKVKYASTINPGARGEKKFIIESEKATRTQIENFFKSIAIGEDIRPVELETDRGNLYMPTWLKEYGEVSQKLCIWIVDSITEEVNALEIELSKKIDSTENRIETSIRPELNKCGEEIALHNTKLDTKMAEMQKIIDSQQQQLSLKDVVISKQEKQVDAAQKRCEEQQVIIKQETQKWEVMMQAFERAMAKK